MANRLRGEARIAGTDHVLVFDANAFCEVEDATGLDLNALVEKMRAAMGFSLVRTLLWAGLKRSRPEITLAQVGDILSDLGVEGLGVVGAAICEAITAAFPDSSSAEGKERQPVPGEREPGKRAKAGAGTGSPS